MKKALFSLSAVAGMFACAGCEALKTYELVTDSILNTTSIAALLGIAINFDEIVAAISGLFS